MGNEIQYAIVADETGIIKSLKIVEGEAQKTGDKVGKGLSSGTARVESALSGIQGKLIAIAATAVAAFSFHKMIDEALQADDAIAQLGVSLRLAGDGAANSAEKFADWADNLSAKIGIADNVIVNQMGQLAAMGHLTGQRLQEATLGAINLSAATGKDLATAFSAVEKAANGHTESLRKMGVLVDENTPKSQKFSAALEQLGHMQGAAEQKANTFHGAMDKMGVAFDKILENFGKMATQSPVITKIISMIGDAFGDIATKVGTLQKSGDVLGEFVIELTKIGITITEYVGPTIELFARGTYATFLSLRAAITEVLIEPLFNVYGLIQSLGNMMHIISDEAMMYYANISNKIHDKVAEFNSDEMKFDPFNFDATQSTLNFMNKFKAVIEAVKPMVKKNIVDLGTPVKETLVDIGSTLKSGIGSAVATTMSTIGASLAQGGKAFDNFGKKLLSLMGDLAIQIGTVLFTSGIGMISLKVLDPTGAIAAGLGLMALGGLMKAVGGGGESVSASTAMSNAGSSASPSIADSKVTDHKDLEQGNRNKIIVNIHGNVFDKRETGLHIIEAMNEALGSNGAGLSGSFA